MTEEHGGAIPTVPRERQYRDSKRGKRRYLQGKVTSAKSPKTRIVSIERRVQHPKYGRYVRSHTKIHAHDEEGDAQVGDTVRVVECRPMSKLKRFRVAAIVERARS